MLINALVEIGKSIKSELKSTKYDSEIVNFISIRYPNPPKMDQIIKINVKPCILDAFQKLKEKITQFDLNKYNLNEYISKILNKQEGKELTAQIIEIIEPNFNDFEKCIAKWVRPKHVKTKSHWKYDKIVKNLLKQ